MTFSARKIYLTLGFILTTAETLIHFRKFNKSDELLNGFRLTLAFRESITPSRSIGQASNCIYEDSESEAKTVLAPCCDSFADSPFCFVGTGKHQVWHSISRISAQDL